jgi:hypothetical protein
MRAAIGAAAFLAIAMAPLAATAQATIEERAIQQLIHRSAMPEAEVRSLLANCDASQLSINFCTWRDALVAEVRLDDASTAATATRLRGCKSRIDRRIADVKSRTESACAAAAEREAAGGSIKPAVVAACRQDAYDLARVRLERMKACTAR